MSEKALKPSKKFFLPLFISLFLIFSILIPIQIHAEDTAVIYTVHLKKLHPDVLSSLQIGARVTDSVSKTFVGTVTDIAVTPHMVETYAVMHDRMMQVPHPFFRDVTLTVRALCEPKKNGYQIGSFHLFRGTTLHFFTADFTGIGECAAIYESEASP